MNEAHEPKYSERFRAADADVTISSSDGVLFKVHRKNLELWSEGFPGSDVPVTVHDNEVVPLTERAATLELLFRYVYKERQPDLSAVPPDDLAELAEAAEKYMVYPAMEVCKVRMELAIPAIPLKVLSYAAKHGYEGICDKAAPHTLAADASEALKYMDPACFVRWVLYRDRWLNLLRDMHTPIPAVLLHKGGLPECPLWLPYQARVLQDLGGALGARSLQGPQNAVERHRAMLGDCVQCKKRAQHWVYNIQARTQLLPKFQLASRGEPASEDS